MKSTQNLEDFTWNPHEIQQISPEIHQIPWNLHKIHQISWNPHEICRISWMWDFGWSPSIGLSFERPIKLCTTKRPKHWTVSFSPTFCNHIWPFSSFSPWREHIFTELFQFQGKNGTWHVASRNNWKGWFCKNSQNPSVVLSNINVMVQKDLHSLNCG